MHSLFVKVEIYFHSHRMRLLHQKWQHDVGFCQHHAARDLLHQEICKNAKYPKDCFQPSVMDFIALDASFEKDKVQYRNSEYTFDEILKRGTVSSEECLSLNEMFPYDGKNFATLSTR